MATVVQKFPAPIRPQTGSKYDRFLDGQIWKLEQGVDFTSKIASTATYIGTYAKKRGIKVTVRRTADAVYVKADVG